ncbi:MAG: UvrD-helicase domain-containing protein, partial [Armatimonadota bacterium]|nr:UvrD-helicase domain-containing protein [Armatimonadota bacterium]
MDLLSGLNAPQRAAVTHDKGPLLIFAGAGSGKTRTLTHRIAYLIREHGVPPGRILAVTFTNKAAREMRERLAHLVGPDANRLWMGTFHALCAKMLRIHGSRIDLDPRFVIFDADDSARLMRDILREVDVDSERYAPARILGRISDAKNNMRSPEEVAATAVRPNDRVLARLYQRYQERLRAAHALDFDDLLLEAVRLLSQDVESTEYWSERFLHVLIDEFQDVNAAQFKWAQLLASKHRNICVVGDDDQSIYQWRGANVRLILDFELSYPDATIIHLEQNYRSTQNILDAAHGVISRNLGRRPKRLWTELTGGAQLTVHSSANAQEEATWVVRKIQDLQRERRGKLADYAILCRINAQSEPFERAFMHARIPLRLVGTQRFYDRKEIKDVISYLRVLYNPHDSEALKRIINVPPRGIGAVTIQKLEALARDSNRSFYDVMLDDEALAELGRAVTLKIVPLRNLLEHLREKARTAETIFALLEQVLEATQYYEYLREEKSVAGIDRIANVQVLLNAAQQFDERVGDADFA